MSDFARHLISHTPHNGHLLYRFPNGIEVSVIPDPSTPLHWELLDHGGDGRPAGALTTDEAKSRLAEIAAQPMTEWDGRS